MSARTSLAEALAAGLPTFRVLGYAADLDTVVRPTLALWVSQVERFDQIGMDRLRVTFNAWLLVGSEDPTKVDDALDAALDEVIDAWQGIPWCAWTAAERGVYRDTFHGYLITAQAVASIGD